MATIVPTKNSRGTNETVKRINYANAENKSISGEVSKHTGKYISTIYKTPKYKEQQAEG